MRKAEPVRRVLHRLKEQEAINHLYLNALTLSPIQGTRGNVELFGLFEHADAGFSGDQFGQKVVVSVGVMLIIWFVYGLCCLFAKAENPIKTGHQKDTN